VLREKTHLAVEEEMQSKRRNTQGRETDSPHKKFERGRSAVRIANGENLGYPMFK